MKYFRLSLLVVVTLGSTLQAQRYRCSRKPAEVHMTRLIETVTRMIRAGHDEVTELDFTHLPRSTRRYLKEAGIRFERLHRPADVSSTEIRKLGRALFLPYYHPIFYSLRVGEKKLASQLKQAEETLRSLPPKKRAQLLENKQRQVTILRNQLQRNRRLQKVYTDSWPLKGRGPHNKTSKAHHHRG